jgi:hypothetical protein
MPKLFKPLGARFAPEKPELKKEKLRREAMKKPRREDFLLGNLSGGE